MASDTAPLAHVLVRDRAEDREFRRRGGGDPQIRDVQARAHGQALRGELERSVEMAEARRDDLPSSLEELRAVGVVIVLEGADAAYPLKLESLQRMSAHTKQPKRPLWLLLSVRPATEDATEAAMVWVSDEYRARFLRLFEDYLQKTTPNDHPRNRELVANIGRIREAVLADLWQSAGAPPASGTQWWELWLTPIDAAVELARQYSQARGLKVADRFLVLNERTVVWVRSSWADLQDLPFTAVPLTEIRRPEFADTIEDLPREDQTCSLRTSSTASGGRRTPPRRSSATSTPGCAEPTPSSPARSRRRTYTRSSVPPTTDRTTARPWRVWPCWELLTIFCSGIGGSSCATAWSR